MALSIGAYHQKLDIEKQIAEMKLETLPRAVKLADQCSDLWTLRLPRPDGTVKMVELHPDWSREQRVQVIHRAIVGIKTQQIKSSASI